MTNSGGYTNADNKAEEDTNDPEGTEMTEDGEISTGANSNDIFSDSAPGEENSAAKDADADTSTNGDGNSR